MLDQIIVLVHGPDLEIIGPGPFGFAFNLIPAVEHLADFERASLPNKPARRFVGLDSGIAFDLDWSKRHAT